MPEEVIEQQTQTPARADAPPAPETMSQSAYRAWRDQGGGIESTEDRTETAPQETPAARAQRDARTEEHAASETAAESENSTSDEGKGGGVQKRIDRLVKERSERDSKIADLERRLTELNGAAKPKQDAAVPQPVKPAGPPKAADFETYEEYIEASIDYRVDQKELAKQEAARRETEAKLATERGQALKVRQDAIAEKYPDWREVVLENGVNIPVSDLMTEFIRTDDDGLETAYFLGKNPKEAERIRGLSPFLQMKALARIAAQFDGTATKTTERNADGEEPKAKSVSEAPEPIRPVGSRSATSAKKPEDMSHAEFRAWREKSASS